MRFYVTLGECQAGSSRSEHMSPACIGGMASMDASRATSVRSASRSAARLTRLVSVFNSAFQAGMLARS